MSITRREKVVKIVQEEAIVLELTPEQAAFLSIIVYQSGGQPSGLRGIADELMRKFSTVGCTGYDIGDPAYSSLVANVDVHWPDASRENKFFLRVVDKFRKIRSN